MTSSKMLFMSIMVMSTIMVISSNSWLNMWMGLEINLMSFIPLMSESKNPFLSQSTMMYFLTQSMASMLFIMTMLTSKYIFINMKEDIIKLMITMSMMMKLGMPPFHMWFPEIMNKIKWSSCFMLMTWQKIAPMCIISMMLELSKTIIIMICMSALIGSIGGINQTSTRKMMAYSSINHMSWMMACAATFKKSWMIYMLLYTMMMAMFCIVMYKYNIMFINQMNMFFMKNMEKLIMIMMILSIGGIPPFIGFLPKWITIQYMISSKEMLMMIIMMIASLMTLSYYLRMTLSMNMIMSHSQKWMYNMKTFKSFPSMIFMLNMMMPMTILMLNL